MIGSMGKRWSPIRKRGMPRDIEVERDLSADFSPSGVIVQIVSAFARC